MLIAAGGTGGHLFPGIAVAEVFKEANPGGEIVFVGSERGLEKDILEREGLKHRTLQVGRIKGEGLGQKIRTFFELPRSLMQARALLKELRPDVVFGIGGYSSGPVILSAFLRRIPRAILEPNAIPGLTNRILGRFVNRVFVAFPEAASYFPAKKVRLTGTPVRKKLSSIADRVRVDAPFTIAVIGGSQGATALNRAVVDLLPALEKSGDKSGKSFRLIHQTGENDFEWVRDAYEKSKVPHRVSAFIAEMEDVYAEADLLIGRAGASTVAEVIATRTPAVLVPYPFAADDHQRFNALSLVEAGGAEMVMNRDLGEQLAGRVLHLASAPEEIRMMRENLAKMSKVPAAEVVTRECLAMMIHA